ncbi:hypothetical protein QOZ80_6BG0472250 [Eleusine coracana subsp. coracana]|nr:hypothetical protein QOZ80_6BG0472250 [Eleusine coracana subsp. coracana]
MDRTVEARRRRANREPTYDATSQTILIPRPGKTTHFQLHATTTCLVLRRSPPEHTDPPAAAANLLAGPTMYSSYSAAAFALRASKPVHAHSSYTYAYLPSHHCHRDDDDGGHHRHHHELLPQSPYLSPRFLLDGYLLRHSARHLLLSARLLPPPPPHPHPPRCCRRKAASRCCGGGGGGPANGRVSCRAEARGCRCSGRGAARSDLGAACRRFEGRGYCCGGSGSGRLLDAGRRRRDAPHLVRRAVRQEVWEYDGEWPHRRCSIECLDDWEEEDEECVYDQRNVAGDRHLSSGRWEEDDGDGGGKHRCRDCNQRISQESYYNGGDVYGGRRRERRDVDEYHGSFRDSDRRRRQQRDYLDDEEDLDFMRRRQIREGMDRREFDFDDAVDTRRIGTRRRESRNAEDARRIDRRTYRRDFEIDDEVDMRREGRHRSNDDQRYDMRRQRRVDDGDDDSLLRSRRRHDDDQDLVERRYYSEGRSQKPARASQMDEDDEKRASSSRNTEYSRHATHEDSSSSRVRWRDNVDRRTSEVRDQRYSVGWSNDERETRDYDKTHLVRVQDVRTGTQDVKVITEDGTKLASSSNNTSILKHNSNLDKITAVHNDESRKSSQNIMEISEVRANSIEQDRRAYHEEDRRNYIENRSSSLESSVKMASDSRRQVDQCSEVNQQLASLAESRKIAEKFTDVTTDSSRNVNSASHLQKNYDEVNQTDIDDRSASIQNITRVTRDKKRIVNQQVIHETDVDVQNVTHVDVPKIHSSDISISRSSQNNSKTESHVNVTSSMNFIHNASDQEEHAYENKVYTSDSAMVRDQQSHLEAGVHGWAHSTSSTNISDNMKESHGKVELTKAHANKAAVASTSESHLQTRTNDQPLLTSAVNTPGSVNEQCNLPGVHASDGSVVISSQDFDSGNGNQVHRMSEVNIFREHRGMSDQQSSQISFTQRNDEQRLAESSQESGEKLVSLEDTERLMQHNMDMSWQQASTSGISRDKDVTSLQRDSTEDGSSMVNANMAQQAITIGSNKQVVRNETTAGSTVASGSSARQSVSVKESMLESAARLQKSSTFHVGQFVDELQKGVSDADIASAKKNEKPMVEGITSSSSRSRMKGPSDEMWDVQSTTSQETFKTADKEEGSSADGATNSASQTPNNESALAKKVHKSLWAFVADIIRLGWIQRGDSHDSSNKSVKKSLSSNSQSTEGWLSSQEHDNDGIRKKYGSTKEKDQQQLINSQSEESESRVVSLPKEENLHAGTQGLHVSGGGTVPKVRTSEGELLSTSSKSDQNISNERLKQPMLDESPKRSRIKDSKLTWVDVMKGYSLDPKAATPPRITTKGSGEVNTGKGMLADTSSATISSTESGHKGDGSDWTYGPSGAIIPYHNAQMQEVMPHDSTSVAMLESPALPASGSLSFEEKNVVQEAPEVIRTEAKDAELKRRMFQRNKQPRGLQIFGRYRLEQC